MRGHFLVQRPLYLLMFDQFVCLTLDLATLADKGRLTFLVHALQDLSKICYELSIIRP